MRNILFPGWSIIDFNALDIFNEVHQFFETIISRIKVGLFFQDQV